MKGADLCEVTCRVRQIQKERAGRIAMPEPRLQVTEKAAIACHRENVGSTR